MTDEQILTELTDIFRLMFDYDGPELTADVTSDDIEAWDSMANITLALEIERRFKIKIKMAEMESLKDVSELLALIKAQLPVSTQ